MIVTSIPYSPRSAGKNLGFAYNELMARLRDEDWACFIDHDACFTTYDWYAQLEEITAELTEPCVLTAVTNRLGSHWQLVPGVDRDNHSMAYHRRVGKAVQSASRHVLRDATRESLMSGVVILLSKQTWLRLGGFADGFLGVDNAIHQAARERGGRVYLMEGVYVYHWYRAAEDPPSVSSPDLGPMTVAHSPRSEAGWDGPALEIASPTAWNRQQVAGRRVLLIGNDVSHAGEELETSGPISLSVVELDGSALERAWQRFREVQLADEEGNGVEFANASFDVIIASNLLERVRRPERILSRLRPWLAPGGRLVTTCRNVRTLAVVEGLLTGRWQASGGQTESRRPIRFFTRLEVEKLLHRTGFAAVSIEALPAPEYAEWVARGSPGQVKVGGLHVSGLPALEVEEFYSRGFLVEAVPRQTPDFGLTSIIIVTHNQLDYTRQCLDSLRRLTDEPYELILVDNASTDGTVEFLSSLPAAKLIVNDENRGFPAAVNQGIAAAGGSQILLLNNDTILTTGWLGTLLGALHRDPMIGLVGPCSNCVSGAQQVEFSYDDLAAMDGFAWKWGKANDGVLVDTDRLVGFCLLIRREVIDTIGMLDERFGIGCFEDDDYCLRAIRAGYRAAIARDAFIHHFGSRTFMGSGVDFAGLLRANQQRFRAKWQETVQAASPAVPAKAPASGSRSVGPFAIDPAPNGGLLLRREGVRLSLCMIVRDSSQTLPACLESIRPWVDEMVIVDTGSRDDTPRIVEAYGGRLFHFPWCDDFAAARNESLRHARGEWLFWMDSDDTISAQCGRGLRALVDGESDPNVLGYVMQVHCPGGSEDAAADTNADVTVVDHVKLIRNRPDLRFQGRIHEQILPAIRTAGGEVAWTDFFVIHSGSDHSRVGQERKRQRDLRLLHLEQAERPEHPFTLFNLGMTYVDGGQFGEAEEYLRRSIARSGPEESQLRKAYALLVYSQMRLGRSEEALKTCRAGRSLFPLDSELRFREGVLLHELSRLEEAIRAYHDVIETREERHFSSVDRGLAGFKARQNLAVVYGEMGRLDAAEQEWRAVVSEMPAYRVGWRGLVDILLRRGRLEEARALADKLEKGAALRLEAFLLRSRVAMAVGDVVAARQELEQALALSPDDHETMRLQCHFLFEHGTPSESEFALRRLIGRDPEDASAHHNLGTLLLRNKRFKDATIVFREALRLRPENLATHLHLGYALKGNGRIAEAASVFENALRLAPEDPALQSELHLLGR